MFDYEPMSEHDALNARFQLMKDGEYDAVIDKAEARMSSGGNNMIAIELSVYDSLGKPNAVRDFLVFTSNMMWKAIHCADSAGLAKEYEEKKFSPDILPGRNVRVIIATQLGNEIPSDKLNGKPPGARYPNKNVVEDYVKKSDHKGMASQSGVEPFQDCSDIPF